MPVKQLPVLETKSGKVDVFEQPQVRAAIISMLLVFDPYYSKCLSSSDLSDDASVVDILHRLDDLFRSKATTTTVLHSLWERDSLRTAVGIEYMLTFLRGGALPPSINVELVKKLYAHLDSEVMILKRRTA